MSHDILIVDDEKDIRLLVAGILAHWLAASGLFPVAALARSAARSVSEA